MTFANMSRTVAMLLGAALLASCDKNAVQDITGPVPGARIKFFNFGVGAPGVNFYADARKMTAISSTVVPAAESNNGVAYGAVGAGGFYTAVQPGTYALQGKIAALTDKDLTIATVSSALVDGKAYSYYLSGIYNSTAKSAEAFVVEDNFPAAIDYTVATVRFVNAISNAQPIALTAFFGLNPYPIGGPVAYKSAGPFVTLLPGVYDLTATGASGTITRTAVSFNGGRVYTISARGDMTVTSTTAATRPFLDNTANR